MYIDEVNEVALSALVQYLHPPLSIPGLDAPLLPPNCASQLVIHGGCPRGVPVLSTKESRFHLWSAGGRLDLALANVTFGRNTSKRIGVLAL